MMTGAKITRFNDDGVAYMQDGEERVLEGFDSIVLALGTVADNTLEKQLADRVKEVYVVGDAIKTGKVYPAVRPAAEIAVKI